MRVAAGPLAEARGACVDVGGLEVFVQGFRVWEDFVAEMAGGELPFALAGCRRGRRRARERGFEFDLGRGAQGFLRALLRRQSVGGVLEVFLRGRGKVGQFIVRSGVR